MDNLAPNYTHIFIVLSLIFFLIWLVLGFLFPVFFKNFLERKGGVFGDGFGSVNALFSGFALAGIVITLFMQQGAIALQQDAIDEQKREYDSTRVNDNRSSKILQAQIDSTRSNENRTYLLQQKAFKAQQYDLDETKRLMRFQQFENTFFQMLADLNNKVEELEAKIPDARYGDETDTLVRGVKSFEVYKKIIFDGEKQIRLNYGEISESYPYYEFIKTFNSYYTTLALLLNYVEKSKIDNSLKPNYYKLVIMPMTYYQKLALYYHIGIVKAKEKSYHKTLTEFDETLIEFEREHRFLRKLYLFDVAPHYNYNLLYDAGIYPERIPQ